MSTLAPSEPEEHSVGPGVHSGNTSPKHKPSKDHVPLLNTTTLRKRFEEADTDGGGSIGRDEFKVLLANAMGESPSEDEVDKMMK